jgi:HAD superfamily hydrolase (TIGR01457 family)
MAGELQGRYRGLILDMDGVIYRGDDPLPGARELFPALRASGISFILLTNNATRTPADFSVRLARMGIDVEPECILTSAGATATYLATNYPDGGSALVLGEAGLVNSIEAVPNVQDGPADFVIVGLFFGLTYEWLKKACLAVRGGARFIATNLDASLPMEGGELWPGAGSIAAAIVTGSGVEPTVIGKPSVHGGESALRLMGLAAEQVLCAGDRLETDIMLGRNAGMDTALLLTGVSQRGEVETTGIRPTYIIEDIPALMEALGVRPESAMGAKG